jgi:DNA processing protein
VTACDRCLRRSALLGTLVPWIARALDERRGLSSVLALGDEELIEAICGAKRKAVDAELTGFDAAALRREGAALGLESVCRHEGRFPPRLEHGSDAVAALWFRGDPRWLDVVAAERPVALVGARRASAYGLEVARGLGRELGSAGVPVVSGMALGVDSAAHEGALDAGGPTIAVLAGGADVVYPRSRRALYRRIVEAGLVVSELPPGTQPQRWSFPARNRIMAGLAAMTVVVEGGARSGSLITASFAADLGRDLGAVPGQVTAPLAAGPNDLLHAGACPVRSAADVLDALYGPGSRPQALSTTPPLAPRLADLLAAVERGVGSVDALALDPVKAPEVLAGLSELELLGLVRRAPGGRYVRCAQQ